MALSFRALHVSLTFALVLGGHAFLKGLTLGVDYYPEAWDASLWAVTRPPCRDAGITMVRVAEFAWHWFQPSEAAPYNFTWLDSALDVLAARGIRQVVGTPTASIPSWMAAADPTIELVDDTARRFALGRGKTSTTCTGLPGCHTQIGAIGSHYANDDRVAAFQV